MGRPAAQLSPACSEGSLSRLGWVGGNLSTLLPSGVEWGAAKGGPVTNPRISLILDEFARHRVQFEHLCRTLSSEELAVAIPGSYLAWGRSRSPALIVVSVQTQEVVARQGESEVKVEYTIRNNGGSDLILGTPTTTCGCSVASIEPNSA